MPTLKRSISALENVVVSEAKRVKYLLKQEEVLKAELDITKTRLTDKSEVLLDLRDVLQEKSLEVEKYRAKLRELEGMRGIMSTQTSRIEKQATKLESRLKGVPQMEAESFFNEIRRLNDQLALERSRRREKQSALKQSADLSALERNYQLTLSDLTRFRERVQKEKLLGKELEGLNERAVKLEAIEVMNIRALLQLEDVAQVNLDWRTTINTFFEDGDDIKTPVEANLKFLEHQQGTRPESSVRIAALQDKSRKYKATMAKMQRKIKELTRALEQNTKSVELEKTQVREAERLQLKAESKVRSLQRILKLLKQEQDVDGEKNQPGEAVLGELVS